jgi:hypothetical protein
MPDASRWTRETWDLATKCSSWSAPSVRVARSGKKSKAIPQSLKPGVKQPTPVGGKAPNRVLTHLSSQLRTTFVWEQLMRRYALNGA